MIEKSNLQEISYAPNVLHLPNGESISHIGPIEPDWALEQMLEARNNGESFLAEFHAKQDAENYRNQTVVYFPGHDEDYGGEQLFSDRDSAKDKKQDKLVLQQLIDDGYDVVVGMAPKDPDDDGQNRAFFERISEIAEKRRHSKDSHQMVYMGHSYGGTYIEKALINGWLEPHGLEEEVENPDLFMIMSASEGKHQLTKASKLVVNPIGARAFPKVQKIMHGEKRTIYHPENHTRRLLSLGGSLQRAAGDIISRLQDKKYLQKFNFGEVSRIKRGSKSETLTDAYIVAPQDEFVTYQQAAEEMALSGDEEAMKMQDYSENEGSRHNYTMFADVLIRYMGQKISQSK